MHRIFRCYARKDLNSATALMERLQAHFDAGLRSEFKVWDDSQILVGTDWKRAILSALEQADAGILLLSPAACASRFIRDIEAPALLASSKLLLVGLRPIEMRLQLSPALQALQIFRLQTPAGKRLSYTECTTVPRKDAFALELYKAVCQRLNVTGSAS